MLHFLMHFHAKRIAAGLLGAVFGVAAFAPPVTEAQHLPLFHRHNDNRFAAWNDGDYALLRRVEEAVRGEVAAYRHSDRLDDYDYGSYFADHPGDPLAADFRRALGGGIEMSNNCYSFAVGDAKGHKPLDWPAPGAASGIFFDFARKTDGAYLSRLSEKDGVRPLNGSGQAPRGFYRIALFVDPGREMHWYREAPDGVWFHKRGHSPVTDRDASGYLIRDPRRADRHYPHGGENGGDINYTKFIGFFAVPDDGIDLDTSASRNQHLEGEKIDQEWLDRLLATSQSVWHPTAP